MFRRLPAGYFVSCTFVGDTVHVKLRIARKAYKNIWTALLKHVSHDKNSGLLVVFLLAIHSKFCPKKISWNRVTKLRPTAPSFGHFECVKLEPSTVVPPPLHCPGCPRRLCVCVVLAVEAGRRHRIRLERERTPPPPPPTSPPPLSSLPRPIHGNQERMGLYSECVCVRVGSLSSSQPICAV